MVDSNAPKLRSMMPLDMDLDGDVDILAVEPERARWYENLGGAAQWSEHSIEASLTNLWGASAADMDGDGDMDVMLARGLYLSNSMALGDMDADCDLDLVVAGYTTESTFGTNETVAVIRDRSCSITPLCLAAPNSTGLAAGLESVGSLRLADDDVRFEATGMAPGSSALLILGSGLDYRPVGGGSPAFLCGGGLIRITASIAQAGPTGSASLSMPLQGLPPGLQLAPGESWIAQVAYRDLDPGPVFNTTNGLEMTWCRQ